MIKETFVKHELAFTFYYRAANSNTKKENVISNTIENVPVQAVRNDECFLLCLRDTLSVIFPRTKACSDNHSRFYFS